MSERIRVILADDHALVLEGLRGFLEQHDDIEVVGVAEDGQVLLDLLEENEADVVVLDLQMPVHGLTALEEIRKKDLPVRVLVLTAFSDGESIQRALELSAEGYALKTESPVQTIEAIRQVAQGRLVFPGKAQHWLTSHGRQPDQLSPREGEVLAHLAKGMTNPEIAAKLDVSENTIRFHLKNIYEKLRVSNRTEAVAWYLRQGHHA